MLTPEEIRYQQRQFILRRVRTAYELIDKMRLEPPWTGSPIDIKNPKNQIQAAKVWIQIWQDDYRKLED